MVRISKPKFKHRAFAFIAYVFLRLWYATLRVRMSEKSFAVAADSRKIIGLAWHNRIFFLPFCKIFFRKKLPMSALISPSRDGAYLEALLNLFGVVSVRGSSKQRGGSAILELAHSIESGNDAFITPDGPRGPKYRAKSGAFKIAEISDANLLILRINPRRYYSFKSWDNFILPLPFTRVDFRNEYLGKVADIRKKAELENLTLEEYVTRRMTEGQP